MIPHPKHVLITEKEGSQNVLVPKTQNGVEGQCHRKQATEATGKLVRSKSSGIPKWCSETV